MEHAPQGSTGTGAPSGIAMDRQISKRRLPRGAWAGLAVVVAALLAAGWLFTRAEGRSLSIANSRLILAPVSAGIFEDSIPVRARVAPLKTVYLDAVKGGRVEEVLAEDGATVSAGQTIVRLSNSDLQLNVMNTESQVMEQLNTMRDQELRLEQNRLGHTRTLVEVDYQIRRLQREIGRREELLRKGHVAQSDYEDLADELRYYRARRDVTLNSQASDERLMANQLAFFKDNAAMMEQNLSFARKSLEEMNVRAPVAGKLSGFDLEIGQSVARGERIGQIDNADEFKLVANIDEFYLSRVDLEQQVVFQQGGRDYRLQLAKIYPNVEGGQFEVDIQFLGDTPGDLRRGQTIQAKLTLGDASEALLIPNGTFFQDTGGQWIFVVSPDGTVANRRAVRLGRRNRDHIEVLEGLDAGEQVIVSPYSGFQDMERLMLSTGTKL
jgi:HlyD family secretion protein